MTSDRVNRYLLQKEKLAKVRGEPKEKAPKRPIAAIKRTVSDTNSNHSAAFTEVVRQQKQKLEPAKKPISSSDFEIDKLLSKLGSRWGSEQMDSLIGNCRQSVISSVAGPFGLGSIVAVLDKDGGNVTTVHNAKSKEGGKKGVYATEADKYKRDEYAGAAYAKARDKYKDGKIIENSQMIPDEYSGGFVDYSQADCDHIKSIKQYHDEGGYMQSPEKKKAFGADSENFAMTRSDANRSLGYLDKKEWQSKIATTDKGESNKDRFAHDNRRVTPLTEKANRAAKRHAPTNIEKTAYYSKKATLTGMNEAGKMGVQQSLGLLLIEFLTATFDEIADAYNSGFKESLKNQSFFDALHTRMKRIAERVGSRWEDSIAAFKEGSISGFLGNLVTMLLNLLTTTGKRIVRVIREGMMSIFKAFKMALFPPIGMNKAQAADAALKLLATGLIVSLGIIGEEAIDKNITAFFSASIPILAPYASTVATVLAVALTGITSAIFVYALDQLDFFSVNGDRKHAFIIQELDLLIAETDDRIKEVYQNEIDRIPKMLRRLRDV